MLRLRSKVSRPSLIESTIYGHLKPDPVSHRTRLRRVNREGEAMRQVRLPRPDRTCECCLVCETMFCELYAFGSFRFLIAMLEQLLMESHAYTISTICKVVNERIYSI